MPDFGPCAMADQGPMVATWQARRAYLGGGLDLAATGGSMAARKSAERRRDELARAGLVTICRGKARAVESG